MTIQHSQEGKNGTFFIETDGKKEAEMVYLAGQGIITIRHTEVDEALRGKNIGNKLLDHAVEYARKNSLKIIPLCPFVKSVFEKKPGEFADVWDR